MRVRSWSFLVLAAGLCAACGRRGTPADEIVALTEAPLLRLDPRFAQTNWDTRVSRLLAPGLVGLKDMGFGPTEGVAEWLAQDDAAGLTWVARLRPDARFPDGRVLDAEDVRYTFTSMSDPYLGSPWRKSWDEIIAAVEVVDARTVRFRLRQPRAPFRTDLDFGIVDSRHARPRDEAVRKAAHDGTSPPVFEPADEVVGAGPYRLAVRGADVVTLARNPYAREPPAADKLTFRTIRDDNSRILALVGGSADLIQNGMTPLVVETLEGNPRLRVVHAPSATITYLGFQNTDAILKDRRVRQAIAMAIDRPRIIAAKFRGRAEIANSFLDARNVFHAPDARLWPHDPAAARRLLDQAGYPDPDGPGPAPRFTLTWKTSSVRFRVALAQVMAQELREVGIEVDVRPFDQATFFDDIKKGNAQLFSLQMTDVVEADFLRTMVHSARIPSEANSWGGANRFRYRDAEVDRLLDEAAVAMVPQRRRDLYATVQRRLAEDLPFFPLWHEHNVIAHQASLRDVMLTPTGRLEGLLRAGKGP